MVRCEDQPRWRVHSLRNRSRSFSILPVSVSLALSVLFVTARLPLSLSAPPAGNYAIKIVRSPPDLRNIIVEIGSTIGELQMPFQWSSPIYTYRVALPYKWDRIWVTAVFNTSGTAALSFNSTIGPTPLTTSSRPLIYQALPIGTTRVKVASALDGNYYFDVSRAPPDILAVTLQSLYDSGAKVQLPYLFASTITGYVLTKELPFINRAVQVTVKFGSAGTVLLSDNVITDGSSPQVILSNVASPPGKWPLIDAATVSSIYGATVREQVITVNSTLDGFYTFRIIRSPPDVTSIIVSGTSTSGGVINNPTAADTALKPSFIPGTLMTLASPYVVSVSSAVGQISFQAFFSAPNAIVNLTLAGVGYSVLTSGQSSANFSIATGDNKFIVSSDQDGDYVVNVKRSLPLVTKILMFGVQNTGGVQSIPISSVSCPPGGGYCQGGYVYQSTVKFIISKVYLQVQFTVSPTVTIWLNQGATADYGTMVSSVPAAIAITTDNNGVAIPGAVNAFFVKSATDGQTQANNQATER
jgi:hypothetical protein